MATIRTAIQVDDRMSGAFRAMNNALNIVVNSFADLQDATHQAVDVSSIQAARAELVRAEATLNQVESSIQSATQQQEEFNRTIQNGGNAMGGLIGKVKSLVGAYIGIKAIEGGMEATDSYISRQARLGLIVDVDDTALDAAQQKIAATAELQNEIFAAAQRSRGEYGVMVDNVAKLGLLAGDAFKDTSEIVAFTETMQKAFKISGASTSEATNAMYQLNQAMASGRLQGDEYRSIIENAPLLADAIAEYCGVSRGELKELSSAGEISADVIKAAVFNMAEDVEQKFTEMPMTFSDAWTSIKNTATYMAQEVMENVNKSLNSDTGQAIIQGINNSIGVLINTLGIVITMVMSVAGFFVDNWSIISPIIGGIATAMGIYTAAIVANNIANGVRTALEIAACIASYAHAAATRSVASETAMATAAQYGFNTALLACPITWVIVAVIALIAVFYAAVAAVNKLAGTTYSATGIMCGVILVALALIWNAVIGTINAIIQYVWTRYAEPFISIIEWVLNVAIGGFDSFGDAVANLIGQIISWFLSLGKIVTKIIDAIFGTNWTAGLSSLQDTVIGWGKNENAITLEHKAPSIDARISYSDAYNKGYDFGKGIDNKIDSMLNFEMPNFETPDYSSLLSDIGSGIGDTADNTGKTADNTETSTEDLKYLRDIAERETINRFTTAEIKVDMGGINNTVNNMNDLDGIGDYLAGLLEETAQIAAEGVHE